MELDIFWEERSVEETARAGLNLLLEQGIEACLRLAGVAATAELSLTLVDNARIHELNREYRQVDRPTDVLSFALQEEDDDEPEIIGYQDDALGDIVISVERAREQAVEYGHSLERELVYLAAHGTLHLLGYDHEQDDEKREMREKEEEVMSLLELGRD